MSLIDTDNHLDDFCENVRGYLEANRDSLVFATGMGPAPVREIAYGQRLSDILNFPSIDVDPEPGYKITTRESAGQQQILITVTVWFYTYNLNRVQSKKESTRFGDRLFKLLNGTAARGYFAQIPPGKTKQYVMRFYTDGMQSGMIAKLDSVLMGGQLLVYGLREIVQ